MNITKRMIFTGSVLFLLVLAYVAIINKKEGHLLSVSWAGEEIRAVYDPENESYFLYLPVAEDPSQLTLSYVSSDHIMIDGRPIQKGMFWPEDIESGSHDLQINGQHSVLRIYPLSDIPKIFIQTNSTTMDKVYSDKKNREKMRFSILDRSSYLTEKGTISGRGKTTWDRDKKSFNLYFDHNITISGLGSSNQYTLLSNARDPSNVRNKTVYDTGKALGFAWTPACVFTDVYLNGEYNGLYLLTEKIEVAGNKVNINPEEGFLIDSDYQNRIDELDHPFVLANGQTFEIKFPKTGDEEQYHFIQQKMQMIDDMITSHDSSIFKYIDLDSWAKKYLLEEVFENSDGGIASQFYYSNDISNGIVFAGPIWDYDSTMGQYEHPNTRNPEALIICEHTQGFSRRYWYEELYQNELFFHQLTSIYEQQMRHFLEEIIDVKIPSYVRAIRLSANADDCLWGREKDTFENEIRYITSYLEKRKAFLDSVWVHQEPYYQIKIKTGFRCLFDLYLTIPSGGKIPTTKELQDIYQIDFSDFECWKNPGTGKVFDESQPITANLTLLAVFTEDIAEEDSEDIAPESLIRSILQRKKGIIVFGTLVLLVIALVVLIVTDRRKQHGR